MKIVLASSLLLACLAGVHTPVLAAGDGPGITANQALDRLLEGNVRFVSGSPAHPNADAARRQQLADHGQTPFVTIVSCSDSRVPVELLFDQGIGDVFVIRVAGNVCDTDEIGSLEYGVDHLNTPLLLVLGHSKCGAVHAVATGAEVHGSIPPLVDNIVPAVARARMAHPAAEIDELMPAAVRENVWKSIEDVFANSDAVRGRAAKGRVKVVGAVYDLATGRVQWMGEHPRQAELIGAKIGK